MTIMDGRSKAGRRGNPGFGPQGWLRKARPGAQRWTDKERNFAPKGPVAA